MLVSMKPILDAAREGHYCVPATNYLNTVQLRKCIEAAEECNSPLILNIIRKGTTPTEDLFHALATTSIQFAKEAKVPVALNLDHGAAFEHIVQAMANGCSSVMVDRSSLSFEENAAQTKEVVRIAHALGISVEAEFGHVGTNSETGAKDEIVIDESGIAKTAITTEEEKRKLYTNPELAVKFVEETGVDCLAVAVGTVHGLYPEGFKPSLDLELLAELREKVKVPLVLHGGSGTGEDLLKKAAELGACKLNVGSDLFKAQKLAIENLYADGNKPVFKPLQDATEIGYEAYKQEVKRYMIMLGSSGKADYTKQFPDLERFK